MKQLNFARLTLISAAVISITALLAHGAYASSGGLSPARQEKVDVRTDSDSDDDVKDDPSVTRLMRAVRDGEKKDFKSLLKRESGINDKDAYGWTALVYAIRRNDFDIVKDLVERGADLSVADDAGVTALMAAAQKGETEVVKYLLDKGADVNAKTRNGLTVLSLVKNGGNAGVVEIIKAAGGVEGDSTQLQVVKADAIVDKKPVFISYNSPSYTVEARRNKVQGAVIVRALVGADGSVKKVRIIKGLPDGLSEQAMIASYKAKFNPAIKDGQPVEFWITMQVEFNLK